MTGSELAPVWRVVLDANVLLQAPIRDTLLRLAEHEVVIPFWSADILAEVARNFAAVSGDTDAPRRLAHLLAALRATFPDAEQRGYESLLPTLRIAPHDRHVLACAIVARARVIVTYNARDFSARLLTDTGVQAWNPDTLLRAVLRQRPDDLRRILTAQGDRLRTPRSLAGTLDRLAQDAPQFADEARRAFGL